MIALKILVWLFVAVYLVFLVLYFWSLHEQTEAARRMACRIMGLPEDTPYKYFEKLHREMRQQAGKKDIIKKEDINS